MTIKWTKNAAEELQYWKETEPAKFKRIKLLLSDIEKNPFEGIGKPVPLKQDFTGKLSRRITQEHRLVYEVKDDDVIILQCRFHY